MTMFTVYVLLDSFGGPGTWRHYQPTPRVPLPAECEQPGPKAWVNPCEASWATREAALRYAEELRVAFPGAEVKVVESVAREIAT